MLKNTVKTPYCHQVYRLDSNEGGSVNFDAHKRSQPKYFLIFDAFILLTMAYEGEKVLKVSYSNFLVSDQIDRKKAKKSLKKLS